MSGGGASPTPRQRRESTSKACTPSPAKRHTSRTRSPGTSTRKSVTQHQRRSSVAPATKKSSSDFTRLPFSPEDKVLCLTELQEGITDFTAPRNEYHFSYFGLMKPLARLLLKDERDEPMVYLMLNICHVLLPFAGLLYFLEHKLQQGVDLFAGTGFEFTSFHLRCLGVFYLVFLFLFFTERFILFLHFSSHRRIFVSNDVAGGKGGNKILGVIGGMLNKFALYFLCPFFGIPPGLYYLHHVVMHHSENNHKMDVSETESYDRSRNITGVIPYMLRFSLGLSIELPLYALKSKRFTWFLTMLFWFPLYIFGIYFFYTDSEVLPEISLSRGGITIPKIVGLGYPIATTFVFLMTHFLALIAMSFGNFNQHVFVNPDCPGSNYGLAYNCLNHPTNQTTFLDGYHIIHHLYPRLHWSEMPQKFVDTLEEHRGDILTKKKLGQQACKSEKDRLAGLRSIALTFRNSHFMEVGVDVVLGRYEKLAREHFVWIDGPPKGKKFNPDEYVPTVAEVAAELKRRLAYIPPYSRTVA